MMAWCLPPPQPIRSAVTCIFRTRDSSCPPGNGRRQVKEELQAGRGASCFRLLDEASQTAADIKDGRAERAISRLRAKALRQTGAPAPAWPRAQTHPAQPSPADAPLGLGSSGTAMLHKSLPLPQINDPPRVPPPPIPSGDLPAALGELRRSMELSAELGDGGADADTLGEMGDVLTEMKDYEQAGRCCTALPRVLPWCVGWRGVCCPAGCGGAVRAVPPGCLLRL